MTDRVEERVEERWYICRACGRAGETPYDLLAQGCEGKPEPFSPESRALQAEQEAERLREALREADGILADHMWDRLQRILKARERLRAALSNPEENE